jgi:protein TonB
MPDGAVLVHNATSMPPRLILAFSLSLILHLAVPLWDALEFAAPTIPSPPLRAELRPPRKPLVADHEPLLKNTLAPEPARPETKTPPAVVNHKTSSSVTKATPKSVVAAAQRKLSEHLFYPIEAKALGLEGEVRLLLILEDDGRIADVSIAASSGHPVLDKAAIRAAYAMGRADGARSREFILPVVFRLQ